MENKFFVDGREYSTNQTALTGGEIKKLAQTSNYHLFMESDRGVADIFVDDGEAVRLDGKKKHFFVIPLATI